MGSGTGWGRIDGCPSRRAVLCGCQSSVTQCKNSAVDAVIRFRAPWGGLLIAVSVLSALLLVATALRLLAVLPPDQRPLRVAISGLPLLVVLGCLFFVVRGYALTGQELIIERLGWSNRWPLRSLTAVAVDPQAMKGSLRFWGNGGLLAFCGWFRNRKLGVYRVFATDPKRSVVLRFGAHTVVITPVDPEAFVAEVNRRRAVCP